MVSTPETWSYGVWQRATGVIGLPLCSATFKPLLLLVTVPCGKCLGLIRKIFEENWIRPGPGGHL